MWLRAKTTNSTFCESSSLNNYVRFLMTGKIAASGSIMYLLKNDGDLDTIPSVQCFSRLFYLCTSLTKPPELPATTLSDYCYFNMFNSCTSLEEAPMLPSTTLAPSCYLYMFQSCTSLKSIKIAYFGNFSGTGVPSGAFNEWVNNVSSTGTFYYNGSSTSRGSSAIPSNWNVQTF